MKICIFAASTLLLSACSEPGESPAPAVQETAAAVAEVAEPAAEPTPEPCYSAPALARAMKLANDPEVMALYRGRARSDVELVHNEFCFVMSSGYANFGFDSEFASPFRESQFGSIFRQEAEEIGVHDLELASAFYDVAS